MKPQTKLIFAFLIIGVVLTHFFACSSKTDTYRKSAPDTTQTFVTAITPLYWQQAFGINGNISVTTIAWRLTKDTFAFDSADANTQIKKWKRDTLYAFEIHLPKKDTTGGKKDSVLYPLLTPKFILKDYNSNPNKP